MPEVVLPSLLHRVALVSVTLCLSAVARAQVGAVTLESPVVTPPVENASYSKAAAITAQTAELSLINELHVPAGYEIPIPQLGGPSSSSDFETALAVLNSASDASFATVAPVPEASTWIAGLFAAAVLAWQIRKLFPIFRSQTR